MLKRKITNELINWKNNPKKKPLLVTGARQVGKTYIIDKFAKENYKNVITINFIEIEDLTDIFDTNLSAENFYKQLTIRLDNINLIEGETLIFLDEVQVCPKAITALKFLCIYRKYDIIVSGSLLGIAYKRVSSFLVGYVDKLEMNSLDFEEFCWANGMSEEAIIYLKYI